MGGSQSRLLGVGAGVDDKEGVGAGVHGGAEGVLGSGTWEGGVFSDETGREEVSEADLSVTSGGGGALSESLADDCGAGVCVVEAGPVFKKGTGVATGVFFWLTAVFPHSFRSSLLSVFFPFLLPLCFSLPLLRSLHPAESLS